MDKSQQYKKKDNGTRLEALRVSDIDDSLEVKQKILDKC